MERDGWKCVHCRGKNTNLQVHHVIYSRHNKNPWDYAESTLQTLCEDCHEERQELIDNAANGLKLALKNIPTNRVKKIAQRIYNEAMEEM